MSSRMSVVVLGVADVARARAFYVEGLGGRPSQDHPGFVRMTLGDGATELALYDRDAAAADAGVPAEGSGFRGVSFHHLAETRAEVDEVLSAARAAGGTVVKPAEEAQWGGYDGWFSDPDGHLWKVVTAG